MQLACAKLTTIRGASHFDMRARRLLLKGPQTAAITVHWRFLSQGISKMREERLRRHSGSDATAMFGLTRTQMVVANKRRAPIAVLSPTKQTAVIECFNNNGL